MTAAAPAPKRNMGGPVPRYDARLKVTGTARYPSDVPVNNPAYACLVTSAIAKGRIREMDLRAAQTVSGVLAILTAENTDELKPINFGGGGGGATTSIQDLGPEIRHDGQIVAVMVADTFEAAREAAYKVGIVYEEQQPSATFGSPGLTEEDASKVAPRARHLPRRARLQRGPYFRNKPAGMWDCPQCHPCNRTLPLSRRQGDQKRLPDTRNIRHPIQQSLRWPYALDAD